MNLSDDLRTYAHFAVAGGKPHWAKAMWGAVAEIQKLREVAVIARTTEANLHEEIERLHELLHSRLLREVMLEPSQFPDWFVKRVREALVTSDIVERLERYEAERDPEVSDEAAAEIRRLRSKLDDWNRRFVSVDDVLKAKNREDEIERLRGLLRECDAYLSYDAASESWHAEADLKERVREALGEIGHD